MDQYDKKRIAELCDLSSGISTSDAEFIVQLENEMTKNKDMVVALNEQQIIQDFELQDKLSACFDTFLKKIVGKFGLELCQSIYDYEPGEELEFLRKVGKNQLASDAQEIASASSKLKALIEEHFNESSEFSVMHNMAEMVFESSSRLARGINEERIALSLLNNYLSEDISILNESIIPYFNFELKTNPHNKKAFIDLSRKIRAMEIGLIDASNSIKKLVSE